MDTQKLSEVRAHLGLSEDQLDELVDRGVELVSAPGEELFRQGDRADSWWVLIEGAIDLIRHIGPEDVVVGRMDVPGRWAGGFQAWDEQGVYLATGRVAVAGRVLQVPAAALRKRADEWFPFGTHLITGLYHTARSIEATARQRDSLLTLSTLAAGLAHELNNPAAAAVRAVDALAGVCESLISSLTSLTGHAVDAAQLHALDALRRAIEAPPEARDALRLADAEDALAAWMATEDEAAHARFVADSASAIAQPYHHSILPLASRLAASTVRSDSVRAAARISSASASAASRIRRASVSASATIAMAACSAAATISRTRSAATSAAALPA